MPAEVVLWSDYVSPYAFVAKAGAYRLAADYDIALDVTAVAALLVETGAPHGFPDFLIGAGGAEHDQLRNEAEASGVFGVPTFVFDQELFWGGDRIDLLRERLDEKGVARRHP